MIGLLICYETGEMYEIYVHETESEGYFENCTDMKLTDRN